MCTSMRSAFVMTLFENTTVGQDVLIVTEFQENSLSGRLAVEVGDSTHTTALRLGGGIVEPHGLRVAGVRGPLHLNTAWCGHFEVVVELSGVRGESGGRRLGS
jgi:hypothetical protein